MPDTMIQTDPAPAVLPASCGVMDGYRSPSIGKLVSARAKASTKIKAIIKAKTADIPSKTGGRDYQYAYADLADVLDAVEDAISEQGLAIIQTTQARGNGTFLITTLAHESDQWVAAEIRVKSADQGPQVYGSEMTYLRRYAVLAALALAPEADDDGKAAQDRADQQARQKPQDRVEQSRRPPTPPKASGRTQTSSGDSGEPARIPIVTDDGGLRIRDWLDQAKAAIDGKPEEWRRRWLELHTAELADLRHLRPDWADRVEAAAIAPDLPKDAAA
jgi:hypothetical protein